MADGSGSRLEPGRRVERLLAAAAGVVLAATVATAALLVVRARGWELAPDQDDLVGPLHRPR